MNPTWMNQAVVPEFILRLDWPNVGRSDKKTLTSRTGVRTRAASVEDVPKPLDLLVLLYLCDMATRGSKLSFNVQDIAKRFGKGWSIRETLARLYRVVSCQILLPSQHTWRRLRIVERCKMDWDTGVVYIIFAQEFRYAADSGATYSIDVARRLARKIGALALYLMLVTIFFRGKCHERWHPYDELRAAMRNSKIAQLIRERLNLINEAWPENPFRWIPRTTAITCSPRVFYEHVFRRDQAEEEQRMDHEIESRNREEFREYLTTLPFWMRERLMARYLERCIFRMEEEERTGPDMNAPTHTRQGWTRWAPTAPMTPEQADKADPQHSEKQADENVKRLPITQDGPIEEVSTPPKPERHIDQTSVPDESQAPAAVVTSSQTGKRSPPDDTNAKRPAGLFDRARARVEHVRARAKRLTERIRGRGRTNDTAERAPPRT